MTSNGAHGMSNGALRDIDQHVSHQLSQICLQPQSSTVNGATPHDPLAFSGKPLPVTTIDFDIHSMSGSEAGDSDLEVQEDFVVEEPESSEECPSQVCSVQQRSLVQAATTPDKSPLGDGKCAINQSPRVVPGAVIEPPCGSVDNNLPHTPQTVNTEPASNCVDHSAGLSGLTDPGDPRRCARVDGDLAESDSRQLGHPGAQAAEKHRLSREKTHSLSHETSYNCHPASKNQSDHTIPNHDHNANCLIFQPPPPVANAGNVPISPREQYITYRAPQAPADPRLPDLQGMSHLARSSSSSSHGSSGAQYQPASQTRENPFLVSPNGRHLPSTSNPSPPLSSRMPAASSTRTHRAAAAASADSFSSNHRRPPPVIPPSDTSDSSPEADLPANQPASPGPRAPGYVPTTSGDKSDDECEKDTLLKGEEVPTCVDQHIGELPKNCFQGKRLTAYGGRAPGPVNPDMLYKGIQYKSAYLGSTQLITTSRPNRTVRMQQAHEAVTRIKAPDGEYQPSAEVYLYISTDKLALVNMDTDQCIIEHPLRTISYIADIANIVVIMARRQPTPAEENSSVQNEEEYPYEQDIDGMSLKPNKIVCHILECDKAQLIAQSIGQAFHLAYLDFLKENGIEDESSLELDYLDVLNSQELMGEDLMLFANKEASKDITIFKQKNELIGIVVIESGWGSIVPTFVIANMSPTGPAARSSLLNVGDQLLAIDGTSVVGLSLEKMQAKLKSLKSENCARLTIVQCPPTTAVLIKRPSLRYQLGFSVQNGTICSLMRGGIAERGGVRVGHRIIEINRQSVVAVAHERIVDMLANTVGEIHMKTMPVAMFRLLTGQDQPVYF